ncbi:MAG TPA: glycosyltransferase [Candidatus Saccharimonadales bacterium]|nr:glycosyltransferase [Candidatus Saccharimonadales bacterium]
MKRIIFYTEPEWAFGSIHYELCKYLFARGLNAEVLPWNRSYRRAEMKELAAVVDVFVTSPQGYIRLVDNHQISPNKIIMIVHARLDLVELIKQKGIKEFAKPRELVVVSKHLQQLAKQLGLKRQPKLLHLGINTDLFASKPATSLKVVGYAGAFHIREEFDDELIDSDYQEQNALKRAYLVQEAVQKAGLKLKVAQLYHNSFVTMPGFYHKVDCVIVSSSAEGAGLPALEAAAAGRLVISTPVGHWPERSKDGGGLVVPIHESKFVAETTKLLQYYKAHPKEFRQKCRSIQEHAKSYDWSELIDDWISLLTS